jgi:hypothetical protein
VLVDPLPEGLRVYERFRADVNRGDVRQDFGAEKRLANATCVGSLAERDE